MGKRIAFVSFRFAGTDGVSLETAKWAEVLERLGHQCVFFGGELDTPASQSFLTEEAHFHHPDIAALQSCLFPDQPRTGRKRHTTGTIHELRQKLKAALYSFLDRHQPDMLIPQNALSLPMNVPLTMGLTELLAETGIPSVAHHHDFSWERARYNRNNASEILAGYYPPPLPTLDHVVINSAAQEELARRRGISSIRIPNVMPFESPPEGIDHYNHDFRSELGLRQDDLLVLQPTRIVPRKGIELAIHLVSQLGERAVLVISHPAGDEGLAYQRHLRRYAELMNVRMCLAGDRIRDRRGRGQDGSKLYCLQDAYVHADLVTYPSLVEGFGNALLEAIYYRAPLVVNRYPVYETDIGPCGFRAIELDGFVTAKAAEDTRQLVHDRRLQREWAEHNYKTALQYFSYGMLEDRLRQLV